MGNVSLQTEAIREAREAITEVLDDLLDEALARGDMREAQSWVNALVAEGVDP